MTQVALFLWRKDRGRRWSVQIVLALSVALGVAALEALEAFSSRIENSIQRDTKNLLAADFQIQAWRTLAPDVITAAKSLATNEEVILQTDFVSTALGEGEQNLTVQIRALQGAYPFYGKFRTEPDLQIEDLRSAPKLLADSSLKARGFKLGDSLQLGEIKFSIAGFTLEEPNTVASAFALGPRLIIHQDWVKKTGLLGNGARAFYMLLVRSDLEESAFRKAFRAKVPDPHWKLITPTRANRQAAAVIEKLRAFLSFVALSALLLGGIGVFMIFRSQFLLKLPQYLSLRCLGLKSKSLIQNALLQASTVAFLGWIIGSILAIAIENILTRYATETLGLNLAEVSYFRPALLGAAVALLTVLVAVLVPLREVLRVPVVQAFRATDAQTQAISLKDSIGVLGFAALLFFIVGRQWALLGAFALSVTGVVILLSLLSIVVLKGLSQLKIASPLFLRHSILMFTRQRGASQLLLLCIGLGIFLMSSVLFLGFSLRSQIDFSQKIGIPNFFMLGVTSADQAGILDVLPNASFVPITQARLTEINGEPVVEKEDAESVDIGRFYKVREYTITRRKNAEDGEVLVSGSEIFGAPEKNLIRASLENSFAERIGLGIGDRFSIEIAGVSLPAVVRSLRKVDWFNLKPNFYIVLHEDDIKDAPMDFVGMAYVEKSAIASRQQAIAKIQPQVTSLDGEAISQRLISLLNQLSFAISSVSIFTLGSCLFVFAGVLMARKPQKLREISLWRGLGLRSRPLEFTMILEFVFTGLLAALTSLSVAALSVFALCKWVLNISFVCPPIAWVLMGLFAVPLFLGVFSWLFIHPLMKEAPNQLFRTAEENS